MPQNVDTNTSPPIGYYEKLRGGRQSRPPSRAEKHTESVSSDRNKCCITKHDCLNKVANPPTRSQSLPPRPPTRRKLSDMPTTRQLSSRAQSSGPASRRDSAQKSRSARSQRSAKSTPPVFAHFTASIKPNSTKEADHLKENEKPSTLPTPAPRNAKSKQRDSSYKNSISDHDYLQFSLRITEDIIRNDLYTNKEMRRVFNSHLEANRGRLDMDKMTQQIDNLCDDLNIPLDETQDDDLVTRSQMKASRQARRNKLYCICDPKPLNVELKDCECGSTRCLDFQCVQHGVSSIENIENNTTYSNSINTTQSSQETVTDKTEEEEIYTMIDNLHNNFVEVQIFDDSESISKIPVTTSTTVLNQGENQWYESIPYYDESERITQIRPSLGFLELPLLPSLSRVTEKTEPTTSCETVDVKLETEPNVESGSEFDSSDVVPVFEHLEQEQNHDFKKFSSINSISTKKSISFGSHKMKQQHSKSPQQLVEENKQEYLVSVQPENSGFDEVDCSLTKQEATNSIEQVPSSAENENVFWLICPYNMPQQPAGVERIQNEEEKSNSERTIACTSIKSLPVSEPHMKTVCSSSPTHYTQSPSISSSRKAILQTRSEPIKDLSKMPIPTPRSCSRKAPNASSQPFEVSDLDSFKESTTESHNSCKSRNNQNACNCDNNENHNKSHLPETSNVKICRGLNNQEEEFILVSGPIYVAKSSIIPMKTENSQCMPIIATDSVKRDIFTFSKDAMVNTDEQLSARSNADNIKQIQSVISSKFKVIKEPSMSSNTSSFNNCLKSQSSMSNAATLRDEQSETYSQVHNSALNAIHYPSFVSNISGVSNIPSQPPPISESVLMTDKIKKNIAKPPKATVKHKGFATQSYSGESNVLTHLNDYDLTPQRDSNRSAYSNNKSAIQPAESQQFSYKDKFTLFNKEALLLGDEYELKDDFGSNRTASVSSCYDNGLPYSICRFYPNISTQTHSSDFLLPPTASLKLNYSEPEDDLPQEPKHSKNNIFNTEYVIEQQEQKKQSILKKKRMAVNKQEPAIQRELEKQATKKQESVKQQKPEQQEDSEKQQEQLNDIDLFKKLNNTFRASSASSFSEKSVSLGKEQDKDSFSELLQINSEIKIFEYYPEEDNKKEIVEQKQYRLEKNGENEQKKESEINKEKQENEINEDREKDEEDEQIEENNENEEEEELGEDDDPFDVLDDYPHAFVHRQSMMMTIEQVTTDLEKFRNTEIPVDEFVHSRYNIPIQNRTLTVADDLLEQQAQSTEAKGSIGSNVSNITQGSYMQSNSKLPFIQVSTSEANLQTERETSSEFNSSTLCCGLRKPKKKLRRDLVDVDNSLHKIPNISTIPDDQLFEIEPRRPTIDSGYGHDRKSLRFDYSAMGKFSHELKDDAHDFRRETLDIKDFTSHYPRALSVGNLPQEESTQSFPVVRNPVVTYMQPKCDQSDSASSSVQFNSNVTTLNNQKHSSIVDILPPQNVSMHSMTELEDLENETTHNHS